MAQEYRDYISECEQLHLNLADKEILFPKDLRTAHERTMTQVAFVMNPERMETFREVSEKLSKYTYQKDGLMIRPAKHWVELKLEGEALHHCVGGYADRMAKGETAIFMLRREAEPDEPYFTLELKDKKVIQCRTYFEGKSNVSYTGFPDIKAFVDEWMEKVVLKGGNKKNRKSKEDAA